jgi:hypothetical protein
MRDNEGFETQHDSITRTFRDTKDAAYDAAIFAKRRCPGEIIYLIADCRHSPRPGDGSRDNRPTVAARRLPHVATSIEGLSGLRGGAFRLAIALRLFTFY